MTQPPDEYGDILRRVLRAEADAVVPSPEGLEIIRGRIERRGVRSVLWWRIGAATVSAVLVAGTVVMVVPSLRERVITPTEVEHVRETDAPPDNSSTNRPLEKPSPSRSEPAILPADPTPTPTSPGQATESAKSTAKPSPSSSVTPTPTPCPSTQEEEAAPREDCPTASASPTPTTGPTDTPIPSGSCPPEECPPDDPPAPPTELTTPLTSNQVS
ncbi:hypothetical protein [Nonomuraea endophytica]|uniref:Cytoskeletal protein RodZ n=1 Tax=Nonomuraea endophytica TaxID=714136 RepID=A0A7W8A8K4_9ACTN|nr:hypothetical protein [Nonomuraea endophytica]MBB5080253.1 cytoskeletal protein RodZ [Nonomuraea endophytica]